MNSRSESQKAAAVARRRVDFELDHLKFIVGLDVSSISSDYGIAGAAIFEIESKALVEYVEKKLEWPCAYESGYLSFREVPMFKSILKTVDENILRRCALMVDGNGVLHERGCGSATMLGVETGLPSIGVSKSPYGVRIEDLNFFQTEDGGLQARLTDEAYALKIRKDSKPIFVSVGNGISIEQSISLVKRFQKFRIPEPIRTADLNTRETARRVRSEQTN